MVFNQAKYLYSALFAKGAHYKFKILHNVFKYVTWTSNILFIFGVHVTSFFKKNSTQKEKNIFRTQNIIRHS